MFFAAIVVATRYEGNNVRYIGPRSYFDIMEYILFMGLKIMIKYRFYSYGGICPRGALLMVLENIATNQEVSPDSPQYGSRTKLGCMYSSTGTCVFGLVEQPYTVVSVWFFSSSAQAIKNKPFSRKHNLQWLLSTS